MNKCLWNTNHLGCARHGACPYDCECSAAECPDFIYDDHTKISALDKLAAWVDVSNKAHAIVDSGGVEIIEETPNEIRAYVMSGQVADKYPVTDGGPYEVILSKRTWDLKPNVGGWIQGYICSCRWGDFHSGEPGTGGRFRGRYCSHAYAAQLYANARARKDFMGDRAAKQAQAPSADYGWKPVPGEPVIYRHYLNNSFAVIEDPESFTNNTGKYLLIFQVEDHGDTDKYTSEDKDALIEKADELAAKVAKKASKNMKRTASRPEPYTYVKDWYVENYPTDNLGPEIMEGLTFMELLKALNEGVGGRYYDLIGVGDSLVRERTFEGIASCFGISYDEVYEKWLGGRTAKRIGKTAAALDLFTKKQDAFGDDFYELETDNKYITIKYYNNTWNWEASRSNMHSDLYAVSLKDFSTPEEAAEDLLAETDYLAGRTREAAWEHATNNYTDSDLFICEYDSMMWGSCTTYDYSDVVNWTLHDGTTDFESGQETSLEAAQTACDAAYQNAMSQDFSDLFVSKTADVDNWEEAAVGGGWVKTYTSTFGSTPIAYGDINPYGSWTLTDKDFNVIESGSAASKNEAAAMCDIAWLDYLDTKLAKVICKKTAADWRATTWGIDTIFTDTFSGVEVWVGPDAGRYSWLVVDVDGVEVASGSADSEDAAREAGIVAAEDYLSALPLGYDSQSGQFFNTPLEEHMLTSKRTASGKFDANGVELAVGDKVEFDGAVFELTSEDEVGFYADDLNNLEWGGIYLDRDDASNSVKVATRQFTYAEMQELDDEIEGRELHNRSRLKAFEEEGLW